MEGPEESMERLEPEELMEMPEEPMETLEEPWRLQMAAPSPLMITPIDFFPP